MTYLVSCVFFFFFFKQKTAYEMLRSLVGSEMCIRDRYQRRVRGSAIVSMASTTSQAARVVARGVQSRGLHSTRPASWKTYAYSPVAVNAPVEKYAAWREDIERTFRADHRTSLRLGLFALTIPAGIFAMCSSEFNNTLDNNGHKEGTTSRGNKKEYM
eukprot:TRINITY_DN13831_c0_g1_i1.p1 TRINITY_DN13831_c0_g1~~TRINITY_DN13831_c0_g1_i1.p1  ORF type:complete len:158 (-),score=41.43 TRINITY_DN13831_c0_g1_i1:266-739(-)